MIPLKLIFQTPHHHRRWPTRPPRVSPPGANSDLDQVRDAILLGQISPSAELAFHREWKKFCLSWKPSPFTHQVAR